MAWQSTRLGEIEEISDGRVPWRPVRHHFGIASFGINAFTGKAAGDRLINEHDETDDGHEELYLVHSGHARFELDGETLDAPAGTLVYAGPEVTRTAFAEEAGTTLIAVGGVPGKAYEAGGWEIWVPFAPLYEAGEYEQLADRLGPVLADDPPYPVVHYNAACVFSLAGRTDEALAQLRRAVELSDTVRTYAADDSDLDAVRGEPAFKDLIG
jgi:mannose-6-phosphate isomerase-like protein (cupin superfamily)